MASRSSTFLASILAGVLLLAACGAPAGTTTSTNAATAQPVATTAPAAATAAPATNATAAPAAPAAATAAPAAPAATNARLNLNTVTQDELLNSIPNFSNRMVREFFEYRPYISIQQFRKEIGKYVSAEQVTAYEQYVYVPIAVDQADAATLQQLPGVDVATAEALIAARPYGSNAAFLTKLASLVPSIDQQQASTYLAN